MIRTSLLLFLLIIKSVFIVSGQSYNVKNITGLRGLSQSSVNSICVDNTGYIWLGSDFGLNRYDGRIIDKYYWDSEDDYSLSDDYISLIYEDLEDNIWVATMNGVCLYDRINDRFIRNPLGVRGDLIVTSVFEEDKHIWFPSPDYNFYQYNKETKAVNRISLNPLYETHGKAIVVLDIVDYNEESLLLLVEDIGVVKFDKHTGDLSIFLSLNSVHFSSLEKVDDYYYASTFDDVYKFNADGEITNQFTFENEIVKPHIYLDIKKEPGKDKIWISSDIGGVFIVDFNLNIINKLEAGPENNQILPENSVKKIHFVDEKTIVIGTVRCGALILYDSGIEYYKYNKSIASGPSDNSILCLAEDKNNQIWIGTDGGGINHFDRQNKTFAHYSSEDVQIVTTILDYSENELLIGSYQKGLYFFNKQTKKFRSASSHPIFKHINAEIRHKIFKDSEGNLWISDGSLVKVSSIDGSIQRFNIKSNPEIFDSLFPIYFSVYETREGIIWFTTVGGLFSYSLKENRFVGKVDISHYNGLYGNEVYSVVEDKFGNVIFGTNNALLYYNPVSEQIREYIEGSSKMNKMFSALYLDLRNRLWVGTNDELMKVAKERSQPETTVFYSLGAGSNIEYRHGAILRSLDGLLYMGSNEGITAFSPEDTEANELVNKTVITNFSILDNKKGNAKETKILIDSKYTREVELNYTTGTYYFNFNAFNSPFEEFTEYAYTLENFEEVWHIGKENAATYTNLNAGEYVFKVKSTNKNGQWNKESTDLRIVILPPWYQTLWFKILLALFIFFLFYLLWKESVTRLKFKHKIDLERSEQEKVIALNQQKLSFFTNISHEIKTPLTLIYSPLKHLLSSGATDGDVRQALPSLYRNARRMTDLIEQLLEFRKIESSTLKLRIHHSDCVALCKEVIDLFNYYADLQGVNVKLSTQYDTIPIDIDKDKFNKVLNNLISNAIKYSKRGDTVVINLERNEEYLYLNVIDSGMGIAKGELDNIFDPFYQVESGVKGTGIGLALTRQLIELHQGTISVESVLKKGSRFKVKLPLVQKNKSKVVQEKSDEYKMLSKTSKEKEVYRPSAYAPETYKLLIVEDEAELRNYLKAELSKDFIVSCSENGMEAFSEAVKHQPDLIISDVMMPEVNGFEFCENIKHDIRLSHIPVILLTAKSMHEDKERGYLAGADAYVPKPFDLSLLKLQINAILKNRQLLLKRFESDPDLKTNELTNNDLDRELLDKAVSIVEENIDNQDFKVSEFVEQMGMSRTLVYNKISAISGKPVKDFILNIRLQKAAGLLTNSQKTVSEIAYDCGFADASYFSTVFKRYYSHSPIQHRNNYLKTRLDS